MQDLTPALRDPSAPCDPSAPTPALPSAAPKPACDLAKTIFASSLVCTETTLIAGDVSTYQFADGVHPTPYGYQLFAQFVASQLLAKGWL